MKFKPEDFQSINPRTSQILADLANKRLAEMLADAPIVYGCYIDGVFWVPDPKLGLKSGMASSPDTHTARLVDIKKIGE